MQWVGPEGNPPKERTHWQARSASAFRPRGENRPTPRMNEQDRKRTLVSGFVKNGIHRVVNVLAEDLEGNAKSPRRQEVSTRAPGPSPAILSCHGYHGSITD